LFRLGGPAVVVQFKKKFVSGLRFSDSANALTIKSAFSRCR
jgi:hypothetical protein